MDGTTMYYFDIKHIKGKENKVVDAPSRKLHVMYIDISTSTSYLKDRIKEANNTDKLFQWVKACL